MPVMTTSWSFRYISVAIVEASSGGSSQGGKFADVDAFENEDTAMKLLVAVDGSDDGGAALAYATDIAEATDGSTRMVDSEVPTVYPERGSEAITALSDAN